ncbi:MAG TPA: aspartate carbamoyltransferase catalytic subunit [Bacillaceae bacterium]
MKHLLNMRDLSIEDMQYILETARLFANGEQWSPEKKVYAANLFFEPSTRTKTSFEMAERKVGLEVIPFDCGFSSVLKGETLYDTLKTLEAIGIGVAVVRHQEEDFYQELAGRLNMHIINGGDGCGQHPTQCLLDLFTIQQEFGGFAGLKVAIVGDLRHSRVAKSNMEALALMGADVYMSGPPEWHMEEGVPSSSYIDLDDAAETADVVMLLRIQNERHTGHSAMKSHDYHQKYGLTVERAKRMKKTSIIMHPAPVNRNVEIADSLVECERSRIFKQMENGVYTRMAVLKALLENK